MTSSLRVTAKVRACEAHGCLEGVPGRGKGETWRHLGIMRGYHIWASIYTERRCVSHCGTLPLLLTLSMPLSCAPSLCSQPVERLRQLALETIDLNKDPYFMRNHLGTYECKLCLTLHTTEGSYLAHTQAKKHQTNLRRRAKEDSDKQKVSASLLAKVCLGPRFLTRRIAPHLIHFPLIQQNRPLQPLTTPPHTSLQPSAAAP